MNHECDYITKDYITTTNEYYTVYSWGAGGWAVSYNIPCSYTVQYIEPPINE